MKESTTICALRFFDAWKKVCNEKKDNLLKAWTSYPNYTSEIFNVENAVISDVAKELEHLVYANYYSIDAIFIKPEDRVHCAPSAQNWFQNIRIAFEHENIFRSGLFQEVSHLLITRADLRVLVTYPDGDDVQNEFKTLSTIVAKSGLGDSDPALLIITGARNESLRDIEWRAFTYQGNNFLPLGANVGISS